MAQLSTQLQAPALHVMHYLTTPHLFVQVHPLISRMQKAKEPNSWLVSEKFIVPWSPIHFQYIAYITSGTNEVHIRATLFRYIGVTMHITLIETGKNTQVNEKIEIQSLWGIAPILSSVIRFYHRQMFMHIDEKWKALKL